MSNVTITLSVLYDKEFHLSPFLFPFSSLNQTIRSHPALGVSEAIELYHGKRAIIAYANSKGSGEPPRAVSPKPLLYAHVSGG